MNKKVEDDNSNMDEEEKMIYHSKSDKAAQPLAAHVPSHIMKKQ